MEIVAPHAIAVADSNLGLRRLGKLSVLFHMGDHSYIHCDVFGGFRVSDDRGRELRFPVAKGAAIFAYMILSRLDRISRGALTGLLWSEKPEATARTALRQCLHQIRAVLPLLGEGVLRITPDAIVIDRSRIVCDADILGDLNRLLENKEPLALDPDTLLRGFEDLDPAYDEWLRDMRSEAGLRLRAGLGRLISQPNVSHDNVLAAAEHLHRIDPAQEIAARVLIEEAARNRDLVSLLRVYQKLWTTLDEEWGEEPSAELQVFVGDVRASLGDLSSDAGSSRNGGVVRKYLTVLAVRPAEGTGLSAGFLEKAGSLLSSIGGVATSTGPGGVDCVFGLPSPGETDAREGLEAALSLHALSLEENADLVGFGVDAGVLLTEADGVGGAEGPPIERAAALAAAGASCGGGVLAASRSARRLKDLFEMAEFQTEAMTPELESGAFRVTGRKDPDASSPRREPWNAFVGRRPFLAALSAAWAETLDERRPRFVAIQGPAGVGKTRLADEFIDGLEAEGVQCARAVCERHHRRAALAPILRILNAFEMRGAGGFAEAPGPILGEGAAADVAGRLIRSVGARPTAILVDDWQWADDATRAALGRVLARAPRTPLLIILTSRENPAEEWLVANSDQIQLPNLNAREVEAKTAHLLRQPLEPSLKREIYAKSGGNPLFLEEICHSLANTDNRPGWQTIVTALPANVQALIAARMERLDSGDLQIVRTAAAHGEQISIDLLSEVSGMRVDAATLSRLTALDVMSAVAASDGDGDGGGVRFKHGVARDVVYSMIPPDAQVDLHRSYAARLRDRAGGDPAAEVAISEILAMHYRGAGDVANALDFAEISGDKALAASSLDKAMWHYGAALDLIDETSPDETSLRRWVSIARRWAVPCVYAASSRHLPALERAETLANRLQDWRAAAWARYWVGYLHFVLGQHEKALRNLSAAGDIAAEEGDAGLEAEAMAIRGCVYSATGKRERGEEQMRAAIVEKDRNPGKRGRPPVTSVYTRANLAVLVADQGRFEEADDLIAEALRRVRGYGHEVESSILNFAAACHLMRRNWDVALDYASRSRERSEKVSSPYLMGMSRCIWGYARHRLGGEEASEGLEMLSTAAWSMEKRGMRLYLSFVFGWLSDALSEAGRFEDVEAAYTAAMARARTGEIVGAAMACRASAIVAMEAGRPEEAASRLEMAANFTKRRASPQDSGANLLARARLDRLTGRVSEARDALARADEIFDRPELVRWQTVAHRIRVELGL